MNALPTNNSPGTLLSSELRHALEALWEVLTVEHTVERGAPIVELLIEEKEKEDQRGGSS